MGLEARIEEALIVDRAGSAVLEDLIMNQSIGDKMELIPQLGISGGCEDN